MKWQIAHHHIDALVTKRNFAYLVTGALLISNLLLSWKVMRSDEKWVLIPQWDITREISVSGSTFSDEYLIDWADALLRDLYTANPQSVDRKTTRFLSLASTTYGTLRESLNQQAEILKKERFSTVFYPKRFTVDQSNRFVVISGDFMRFFVDDQQPVVSEKTFHMAYTRGPRGVILVEKLQEVKQNDD